MAYAEIATLYLYNKYNKHRKYGKHFAIINYTKSADNYSKVDRPQAKIYLKNLLNYIWMEDIFRCS